MFALNGFGVASPNSGNIGDPNDPVNEIQRTLQKVNAAEQQINQQEHALDLNAMLSGSLSDTFWANFQNNGNESSFISENSIILNSSEYGLLDIGEEGGMQTVDALKVYGEANASGAAAEVIFTATGYGAFVEGFFLGYHKAFSVGVDAGNLGKAAWQTFVSPGP